MNTLLARLAVEEEGQDLVEYMLLAAFVGLAGLAVWLVVQSRVAVHYVAVDKAEQDLWIPPNP